MATRYFIRTEDCAPGSEYRYRAIGVDTQPADTRCSSVEVLEVTEATHVDIAIDLLRAENGLFEGCDVENHHTICDTMMSERIDHLV